MTVQVQPEKPKAPIFVVILAWFMLLGGIFGLLDTRHSLLLGESGKTGISLLWSIYSLITNVGSIVLSFGIRYMRRWALHAFTALMALEIILSFYPVITSPEQKLVWLMWLVTNGITAIVLIYLWKISKRFI